MFDCTNPRRKQSNTSDEKLAGCLLFPRHDVDVDFLYHVERTGANEKVPEERPMDDQPRPV